MGIDRPAEFTRVSHRFRQMIPSKLRPSHLASTFLVERLPLLFVIATAPVQTHGQWEDSLSFHATRIILVADAFVRKENRRRSLDAVSVRVCSSRSALILFSVGGGVGGSNGIYTTLRAGGPEPVL